MADIPESTKMANCPFCGGTAYRGRTTYSRPLEDAEWADGSPITEAHFVNCSTCLGTNQGGPFGGYQTPEAAIAAWNTRAAPPAMDRQAVKEAEFLLDRLAEFEREITDDEVFTHFNGHVSPSAARLRMCLSTLSADAIRQGEGWQPIETAPRDGTWFIADGGGLDRPTPMKWCERVGAWEADAVMLEDWDQQAEGYSRPLFWFAIPDRLSTADSAGKVWRDIESAPKDGTEIDLWCHVTDSRPIRATDCAWLHLDSGPEWYTRGEKGWEPLGAIGIRPTHWMPFPATPASHASDGGTSNA